MRLREVFRYELEHRLRSPSTWVYAVLLFLVAIWMFLATADGGSAHVNAPERIAGGSIVVGIFGMLVTAALCADAAVRDVAAGMDPLLFTSRLRKPEYIAGRYLAALAVNVVILVVIPLGMVTATAIAASFEPAGPFRLAAYAQAFVLILLPNLVVTAAILFTVGMLTRQAIPVYLTTIALFIGNIVALNYPGAVENPILAPLADPMGGNVLQRVTEYWTEAERNTRLLGFPGALVWNRVVWLMTAAGVLGALHATFRFAHAEPGGGRWKRRRGVGAAAAAPGGAPGRPTTGRASAAPVAVPRVAGSFGAGTSARQALAVARNALAEVAGSRWFVVVLLACVGLTLLWGWNVGDTVFDTSTWPATFLITEVVLGTRFAIVPTLLVVLYAGELVWKDREVGVAEIADAAPVPEGVALLGRFLALLVMLLLFQAASMVGGMLIQALQGYYDFELGLYLGIVFGLNLVDYVLLAALAMTIHVFVNHKYLGHILVLLAYGSTLILPRMGIVRHHLLLYGTDPGWTYSDMNGFGPFLAPFAWFKLYWGGWALLLGVLAVLLWVRGPETGMRRRLGQARARLVGSVARAAVVAMALIVGFGGFIFYNTNILNEYRRRDEIPAPQAEYEKRYGVFEDAPQPTIIAADLRVEVYPEAPAVDLRGTYRLVNRTGASIDSVHVFLDPKMEARALAFDRGAEPALVDDEVGYRIFALERPLAPGESLELAFDLAFRPRGFPNGRPQTEVVGNGSYFNRTFLPFIGYQPMFELAGAEARQDFGLEPRPVVPEADDEGARRYREAWRDADLVDVEMVIGTAADQIAVTPGELRRSWTENGRRYFHYRTGSPTAFGATVFSGEYEVLEDRWNDVALRILHHPGHHEARDRMMAGMKAALDYFTAEFGPYPASQLRIVEIPRYDRFGRAHPHTIAFTEDFLLTRVDEGRFDQLFFGTVHEVAHQWWGGQARGAPVRGAGFMSESLANYSAMMVTEKAYGAEAAREVYDFQMDRYLRQRGVRGRDAALLDVADQPWIFYGKGAVAMYLLREHIGEARVNGALRGFLETHRDGGPPYPTARDLYAELRAATPDSLHGLLEDLFETVTLWDVRTRRAVAEPTATGEYVVTLDVIARKVRADSVGNETEVPMDDLVEIGVFGPAGGDGDGKPLYLQRHRIRSGEQTIRVTVPSEPARAGIDPWRKLIDRQRGDNVVEVGTGEEG